MANITWPKFLSAWSDDSRKSLQVWIDQMRAAFDRGISVGNNLDAEVVEIDFPAGSIPSKLTGSRARPLGVVLLSLQQTEPASNTPPVIADAFSWTFDAGSVSLPSLGSIAGSAKYRATILVVRS